MSPLVIALIGALPSTFLTACTLVVNRRQSKTLGRSNGKGTLVAMVEDLHDWKVVHKFQHKLHDRDESRYREEVRGEIDGLRGN